MAKTAVAAARAAPEASSSSSTAADAGLPPDYALLGKVSSGYGRRSKRIGRLGDPASGDTGTPRWPTVVIREDHGERRARRPWHGSRSATRRPTSSSRGRRPHLPARRLPRASWLVLAFYPGDFTPVCTRQFCSYRDAADRLDELDAEVLGDLAAVARLPRALPRQVRADRAAARRPGARASSAPTGCWARAGSCAGRSSSSIPRASSATATSPCSASTTSDVDSLEATRCDRARAASRRPDPMAGDRRRCEFTSGGLRAGALAGESIGEGPPVVLLHGVTATRRYVVHGSKALARRGLSSGDLRRPRARSVRSRPCRMPATPMRELVADLEAVVDAEVGADPSCSPGTRWALTPPSPTRSRIPTAWPGWS